MADFEQAFQKTMKNEGGFVLHNVKNDRGGQTYAGIARKAWPNWNGWEHIDAGGTPPTDMVRQFYSGQFWFPIKADRIEDQRTAETLYDAAVNFGTKTAIKLAQATIGVVPDGVVGPKTIEALNASAATFQQSFFVACMARYAAICNKDRSQSKFLLGWLNRSLRRLA